MCGRFALSITPARFQRLFGCPSPEMPARYNIAPDSPILIVRRAADGGREAALARWGLLPPWSRDLADPARQINARIETAADKPMFKNAFRRGRCLVPADGFYEWQKQPVGPSRPFFVRLKNGEPMAFAGLWARNRLADGSELDTCAILTMDAPPSIRAIHPRMPVVVLPEQFDLWLDPTVRDPRTVLLPLDEQALEPVPVSLLVNNPRNDGPELVAPDTDPSGGVRPSIQEARQRSLF